MNFSENTRHTSWAPVWRWWVQQTFHKVFYRIITVRIIKNYYLRPSSSFQLSVPWYNLEFGSRAFQISAPKIWNLLPASIRNSPSLPLNMPRFFIDVWRFINRLLTYLLSYLVIMSVKHVGHCCALKCSRLPKGKHRSTPWLTAAEDCSPSSSSSLSGDVTASRCSRRPVRFERIRKNASDWRNWIQLRTTSGTLSKTNFS